MIILNKKRIFLILEVIIVALAVSYLKMPNKDNNTIQTVAVPVTNKVIVVDAGHGNPDKRSRGTKWNNRIRY